MPTSQFFQLLACHNVSHFFHAGMPDCPASGQSITGMKKITQFVI
jgi:hypothetical protein